MKDINTFLETDYNKSLLRFITCGSVDDGKSTLIGRLLYDCNLVLDDQLAELRVDSKNFLHHEQEIDFSLLVDGLAAEREQGITIDVAYRFFTTKKRKFIVADTPGHEQFTRNMITGASTAELAVILIDARKGMMTQTKRHSYLCHLMGIKNFVIAVNKMDLVNFNEDTFKKINSEYKDFANSIGILNFTIIPISALRGDNISKKSSNTKWYNGSNLLDHLETIVTENSFGETSEFLMPVQWVNRTTNDFRGYSGKIASGRIKVGDAVKIFPSGKTSKIDRIVTYDGDLTKANVGECITLTFKTEVDCSRGQIITDASSSINLADQFETTLIWMDDKTMIPGRSYYIKIGTQTISAKVLKPKYTINVNTLEKIASKTLDLNDICITNIILDRSIPYVCYSENRMLGSFILIDKMSNATVAAGLINYALRRSQNIQWQNLDTSRDIRANLKNQKPIVLWMTGLSGSGKSSIANVLEKKLVKMNYHTFLLDGDNVRHGLNKDLGFTDVDRVENMRRVGEVARLMTEAGLIVIVAFISPFKSERDMVREMMVSGEFLEIYVDTPLNVAEKRDVKGLYAKARSGELKNFTGIDSTYEIPKNPDIHIKTVDLTIEDAAELVLSKILNRININ